MRSRGGSVHYCLCNLTTSTTLIRENITLIMYTHSKHSCTCTYTCMSLTSNKRLMATWSVGAKWVERFFSRTSPLEPTVMLTWKFIKEIKSCTYMYCVHAIMTITTCTCNKDN